MPNPLFSGWYADPEIHYFEGRYYLYPTGSASFDEQHTFECWHKPNSSAGFGAPRAGI